MERSSSLVNDELDQTTILRGKKKFKVSDLRSQSSKDKPRKIIDRETT